MITFLSVTALLLQWQSWAAVTLTLWPIGLKLFTNWVLYKMFQAEEKAQSVKSSSGMHNNLSLDPRTHIKKKKKKSGVSWTASLAKPQV